ncbi:MAG: sigma factor-like helix-turn-helix DNA-binding protein, partial [Bacteroidota bacterium]
LRDIQQLTYEEIAEITNLPMGTVKSRINRGRTKLQRLLKDVYQPTWAVS